MKKNKIYLKLNKI